MDSEIALCKIARTRPDVSGQGLPIDFELETRSNAVAVAFLPYQSDENGIVLVATIVLEQVHGLAAVDDQQIQISIVVQVPDCQRATDLFQAEARS